MPESQLRAADDVSHGIVSGSGHYVPARADGLHDVHATLHHHAMAGATSSRSDLPHNAIVADVDCSILAGDPGMADLNVANRDHRPNNNVWDLSDNNLCDLSNDGAASGGTQLHVRFSSGDFHRRFGLAAGGLYDNAIIGGATDGYRWLFKRHVLFITGVSLVQ